MLSPLVVLSFVIVRLISLYSLLPFYYAVCMHTAVLTDADGTGHGDTSSSRTSPVLSSSAAAAHAADRLTGVIIKAASVQQLGTIEVIPATIATTSDTLSAAMEGLDISGNGAEAAGTEPKLPPAKVSTA
jgi:hypothetical protein